MSEERERAPLCPASNFFRPMNVSRRYHYEIALGSAAEECTKLDTVVDAEVAEQQQKLRRIEMMLRAMSTRR